MILMYSPVKQPRKPICPFFVKDFKIVKTFSSTSSGREKLIDLSNKLQDGLLKGIADLSVIQHHSNGFYRPYTLQAQRKLNRKRKEQRTENHETKISGLVEQDRSSKRQKSNGNRNNECIICGKKTFGKDSKLYGLYETERAELFLRVTKFNMDAVFTEV